MSQVELLDLAFFKLNVLADHRVVLPHHHFFGHRPRVLLGHVEVTRVSGRVEADLDRCWFSHGVTQRFEKSEPRRLKARACESSDSWRKE